MKQVCLFAATALFFCVAPAVESVRLADRRGTSQDRTITQVVKLLQGMMEASRTDADTEHALYATYKCYVDTQTAEKEYSVKKLTKQIGILANKIEELQSENAQLSVDVAQLQQDMDDNKLAQAKADKLRDDEKKAYDALKKDMTDAIDQLGKAIEALADIGADQNLAEGDFGADHEQYMAGYKGAALLKVQTQLKKAMMVADTLLTSGQKKKFRAFVQEPFAGAYMTQSGEVIGILKDMKETFSANLKAATAEEKKAIKTHAKFIKSKGEEWTEMDKSATSKQSELSANDLELTTKKGLHSTAVKQKADDEEFLEKLKPLAVQKAKEYEARVMWRANEDAAISEAIAILDSDKSFKAFGKVKATKTGATAFLQMSSKRRHSTPLRSAKEFLQKAAKSVHSKRLARIASILSNGNPFTMVLDAIDGVKKNIKAEGVVDKTHFDWCADERKTNKKNLADKKKEITQLNTDINKLDDTINNPTTGLKAMIEQTETDLTTNRDSQKDETKTRKEENVEYQRQAAECEDAEAILDQAIEMLSKYYADMEESYAKEITSLAQEDPAPPSTWGDDYTGQSDQGDKVITMLKFVATETHKEATTLHETEVTDQHAYEDAMDTLTTSEEDMEKSLAKDKGLLADAEEELENKKDELEQTEKEKAAIEKYLLSIKPGCDFITDNFNDRETSRGKEVKALDTAITKLKGTPGFSNAALADKHEDWEKQGCKDICVKSEAHADCKACLADVSVPGYCTTHPTTVGC